MAWAYAIVVASWLLPAFTDGPAVGQDIAPYLVAGQFVGTHDSLIYTPAESSFADLPPLFLERQCELLEPDVPCEAAAVPAVSPPVVLPIAAGLAKLDPEVATVLVRLVAAGSLMVGMWQLWVGCADRSPRAPAALLATAVCLLPFVSVTLAYSQSSPLLFASAALAPAIAAYPAARRWLVGLAAAFWVLAAAFKVFPVLLVALCIKRRWWLGVGLAGALGAALLAATVAMVPLSLFGDYLAASRASAELVVDVRYDLSVQSLVHTVWPDVPDALDLVVLVVLMAGVVALWHRMEDQLDPATEWAFLSYGIMLAMPLLWWHYAIVGLILLGRTAAATEFRGSLPLVLPICAALCTFVAQHSPVDLAPRTLAVAGMWALLLGCAHLLRSTSSHRRAGESASI